MQRLIAWLLARYTDYRVVAWAGGKIAGIGFATPRHRPTIEELEKMLAEPGEAHIIIAPDGSISGAMGTGTGENTATGQQGRRQGHSALRFNRETGKLEPFDPHPSSKPWPLDRRARVR